ncbi:hypothetical protein AB0L63_19485 [Nocardia sp. NPDC051990]|uniref:hypothetical protein n=1 Tax=Nocardia sp. NPDC051990 TaxID=3155285 RepID=UPI00344379E0
MTAPEGNMDDIRFETSSCCIHPTVQESSDLPIRTTSGDPASSSDTGVLKSEEPQSFFSPWLTKVGLPFTDALLIDDRTDNCAAFELQAGVAVEWSQ